LIGCSGAVTPNLSVSRTPGALFKVWGEAQVTGKPFPFESVATSFVPQQASLPNAPPIALTRPTDNNGALLFHFTAPTDTLGGYVMELQIAGKPLPRQPLP